MAEAMLRGGDGEIFLGASFNRPSPSSVFLDARVRSSPARTGPFWK
jgi:hypothetical protein|tara:strand:- start:410 stop:547 length:138 start_codon:yes stop_codon:yes gene_type:complete